MRAKEVKPTLIVAGTHQVYGPCNPVEIMQHSDDLANDQDKTSPNAPRVAQIGTMPLFVALEGKNRVELFKKFRRRMRVLVTKTEFPSCQDINIIKFRPWSVYGVKYKSKVCMLPFPKIVIPLLRAYGVEGEQSDFLWKARTYYNNARADALAAIIHQPGAIPC